MNLKNNRKGITMTVLVVTIVLLIIIAGITVNAIIGEDGIIKTAKDTKERANSVQEETQRRLNEVYDQTRKVNTNLNYSGDLDTFRTLIAEAITQMGQTTSKNASASEMAENIKKIRPEERPDDGTAAAENVLEGKTFTSKFGKSQLGKMKDYSNNIQTVNASADDKTTTIDILDGYHTNIKVNSKPAYDAGKEAGITEGTNATKVGTATAGDVLAGKTFTNSSKVGEVGTMATLTNKNFTGAHSSEKPGEASNYTVTSSAAGYVPSGTQVNSIAATTSDKISTTAATGEQTINIKPGYYNKIKVDQTAAYNAGNTAGVNATKVGTATAGDVLAGKTFTNSSKVGEVGTMATLTNENFTGAHSSTTAGAASNYTVTSSKAGYVPSGTQVNSIAATTSDKINTTAGTGEETINIKPGYYNKIKVDRTAAYNAGNTAGVNATKVGTATADKVLTGYTFTNSSAVGIQGTMPSYGVGTKDYQVGKDSKGIYVRFPYGYYAAGGSVANHSYLYLQNEHIGTAAATEVLSGKTFTSSAGAKVSGTMKDFSSNVQTVNAPASDATVEVDITDGYHTKMKVNGKPAYDAGVLVGKEQGTAEAKVGDAVASDVLAGKTFTNSSKVGEVGTMATLTNENFTGAHSSTTAGAASNYTVTSSKAGYVPSGTQVNSIAATTSDKISTTAATGEQTINIKPGYYNKIKVDQTAAYNAGNTAGVNATKVGTATADKVLTGYTFTNSTAVGIDGTMVDKSGTSTAATTSVDTTNKLVKMQIPANAYYNTEAYLQQTYANVASTIGLTAAKIYKGNTILGIAGTATSDATAAAGDILKDKTAYVNGSKITGTMATLTSANFTGAHSSTTAGAASNYTVTSSKAGYVPNGTQVNSIAATTSDKINTTAGTGEETINIKPGYYNKIKVDRTAAYNAGNTAGVNATKVGTAAAGDVLEGKTFTNSTDVGIQGTMKNLSTSSIYQHTSTNTTHLIMGDNVYQSTAYNTSTKADTGTYASIRYNSESGYIQQNTLISVPASKFGNATQAQVLSGRTFTSSAGVVKSGSMKNFSSNVQTVSAPASDETAEVDITDGYHTKIKVNGKPAYDAGKAAGEAEGTAAAKVGTATAAQVLTGYTFTNSSDVGINGAMPILTGDNFTGAHSSTTPGAASNYTVTSSAAGYVPSGTQVNSIAATTSPTIATTGEAGTKTINVKPGYYNKISVNQTAAYNAGITATKVGTAGAGDVLVGKTFTNNTDIGIEGTMANNGAIAKTIGVGETYTVPAGYHNGAGTVTGPTLSGDAAVGNVLTGKKFYSNSGTILTGTMKNFSSNIQTVSAPANDTTAEVNVTDGFHTKIKVNGKPAYDAGVAATKVGTATAAQVLAGYTFTNSSDVGIDGAMVDKSGTSTAATTSVDTTNKLVKMQIPANAYYNTEAYLQQTYANVASAIGLTAAKIYKGNTILGIAGTATSDATAAAGDILKDKTAYVNGSKVTGSMVNKSGTSTAATTSVDTTNKLVKMQIPANAYYNTEAYLQQTYANVASAIGLTAAKIYKGNTILGIAGTATSDATAAAGDILKDKTAYVNGSKVTGSMVNKSGTSTAATASFDSTNKLVKMKIPANGYYNTEAYLQAAAADFGAATKAQVLSGKTFTSTAGLKVSGSMKDFSSNVQTVDAPANDTTAEVDITDGYHTKIKVNGKPAYDAGVLAGTAATKVGTAVAANVLAGKTFTNSTDVGIEGAMVDKSGTTQNAKATNKSGNYIRMQIPVDGYYTTGSYIRSATSNFGNATQAQVLAGRTFTSTAGLKVAGTMVDYSGNNVPIIKLHREGAGGTTGTDLQSILEAYGFTTGEMTTTRTETCAGGNWSDYGYEDQGNGHWIRSTCGICGHENYANSYTANHGAHERTITETATYIYKKVQ